MQADFRQDIVGAVELRVTAENGDQALIARMLSAACARTVPWLTIGDDGSITVGAVEERQRYTSPDDFAECWKCQDKTGSPTLCYACLHNRTLVSRQSE